MTVYSGKDQENLHELYQLFPTAGSPFRSFCNRHIFRKTSFISHLLVFFGNDLNFSNVRVGVKTKILLSRPTRQKREILRLPLKQSINPSSIIRK